MTDVSQRSHKSRMTVYKRSKSKDLLVKAVVLDDWTKEKKELKKTMNPDSSPEEKACRRYTRLKSFCGRYSAFFIDVFAEDGPIRTNEDLAGELADISGLSRFAVEALLAFVPLSDVEYEEIEPQIRKIL